VEEVTDTAATVRRTVASQVEHQERAETHPHTDQRARRRARATDEVWRLGLSARHSAVPPTFAEPRMPV
jgi:hypothetical protein